MLIDLPTLERADGGTPDFLAAALRLGKPKKIATGVYRAGFDFNFNHDLSSAGYTINYYPFDRWGAFFRCGLEPGTPEHEAARDAAEAAPDDYGVCDSWEQITERWPQILTDPRRFVIGLTEVRKAHQSSWGGWRWHKWGEYIGTQTPTEEYLYDEPVVESVWCFHIIEVLAGPGIEVAS